MNEIREAFRARRIERGVTLIDRALDFKPPARTRMWKAIREVAGASAGSLAE